MFEQVQNIGDEIGDEVKKCLSLGIVTSSSFIDVIEWWTTRKDVFPTHYQRAMNYLGTLATSMPSERVNSVTDVSSRPRGNCCHHPYLSRRFACVPGLT
jgi:hypothetical protein